MNKNEKIIPRNVNFADWYTSVIQEAKLIQYTDIKGFTIFEPSGWIIWEKMQAILDQQFKTYGVKNLYMPLLIPMAEFEKEKDHVEGFAPELFTITKIGEKELSEKLVIRPTSEIWFCKYFRNVVKSYKDLPLKTNQWTSVLRAEKNTRPFLRNSEFHWPETHCIFETFEEADKFSRDFLDLYANFCEKELCIPVVKGRKTENEKFAGADISYTIESMMQDGQALQSGTSHVLGQNFTKAYDIKFQDANNTLQYPFTTSHAVTTRLIGALIMVHGDDNGLVLPFSVAEQQIKIFALFTNKNPKVLEYAQNIYNELNKDFKCEIINSDKGVGYLLSESEVKGTPINIIIGPNDLEKNTITYTRRDESDIKHVISANDVLKEMQQVKIDYTNNLFNKAKNHLESNIIEIKDFEQFKKVIENKQWAKCYFAGDSSDENKIKELTGATARCILIDKEYPEGECFYTNKKTNKVIVFARAY